MTTQHVFIYATFPEVALAEKIAQLLISARLAACANIIPGAMSIYPWQGKIESSQEVIMFVKTTAHHAEAAMALIREHHPYRIPAILSLPISGGNPDFLAWIHETVGEVA
jgi:periplasmic divalent cation tolerance protein